WSIRPPYKHRARSADSRGVRKAAVKNRDSTNRFSASSQRSSFGRRDFLELLLSGLAGELASPVFAHPSPVPLFRDVAEEVGVKFHHFTGATGEFYMPEIMGAGVALFDYDNDRDLDVYLIQGATFDPAQDPRHAKFPPPAGWKPGNRLFRNLLSETGKLQFVDVTEQAGVGHVGYGMGVAVGDYDNDGFQDLYVTNFGRNVLYHNSGDGTFEAVTEAARIGAAIGPGLGVVCADFNGDGWPDIYVANDGSAAHLWINQRNGTFKEESLLAGAAYSVDGLPQAGMGVTAGDFDGDGDEDIFKTNLTNEGANLYVN